MMIGRNGPDCQQAFTPPPATAWGVQIRRTHPLGRTVRITLRKAFLPPPGSFRRERREP
jgi:hypothetical protein